MKLTRSEAGKLGGQRNAELAQDYYVARVQRYNENPKLCKFCALPISYEKRENTYCNHSCAASFVNKGVRRHGERPKHLSCLHCDQKLSGSGSKYCSQTCSSAHRVLLRLQKVAATGNFGNSDRKTIKAYLIQTWGHYCSICHGTEWMGMPMPLILDHINGHADNNSISNLRLVCGNCDMQLPTYKGKNVGNGRHSRRERYAKGQSY